MPKIVLEHVTKRWDKFYGVDDLNLVIEDNAFVTLLGPSGCGKTTTLRMIAGLETPTSGKITIGDTVVYDSQEGINVPPNKRSVGFLFQNYALWPNMTVYENIAFGLQNMKLESKEIVDGKEVIKTRKLSKQEIDERVERVSKLVKIGMFMDRYPAELSGGQQQRVAIARTLAPEPKVLFMDEPLSNLDAKLRLEMRSELQRLHLNTGSTFVYVTHDQMEAMTLATRICLIDNGILQQYDPPLTVYNQPNNTFVADFVGNPAINFINAKGKQNGSDIELEIFDKLKVKFKPTEPLDLASWRLKLADILKEKEEAEAAKAAQKGYIEKQNKEVPFKYPISLIDDMPESEELSDEDFVIGIRPEFVTTDGKIDGEIYSSMPTGMETTLRIAVGNYLMTSVMFGGVVYALGDKVKLGFKGSNAILFDRKTGRKIALGALEIE